MNKADLVSMIAAKSNLTKKDSESALNAFVETVQGALKKGEKIQLVGFGTFEVRKRNARNGVNPRTKQSMGIFKNALALVFFNAKETPIC